MAFEPVRVAVAAVALPSLVPVKAEANSVTAGVIGARAPNSYVVVLAKLTPAKLEVLFCTAAPNACTEPKL